MIKVENVRAGYSGYEVLHGVSFELKAGESLSIIGPNGCGKTTLLRTIAGTLPFTGEVLLDNVSVRKMKRKVLAQKVSMLSQATPIYFNFTVLETVLMGRYVHGNGRFFGGASKEDVFAAEEALNTVGMLALKGREVDTLSGGQLQRVFLAKLLAQNPDVILLDEPTNHLDLTFQIEFVRFLKTWSKREGKTVIGVIHDLNLAMSLADKALLVEDGHVKSYGNSSDVYSSECLIGVYKTDIAAYMIETLRKWEEYSTST